MGSFKAWFCSGVVASLMGLGATQVIAATSTDVVPVDLNALIRDAVDNPSQFAVNVPHMVTTESAGIWSESGAVHVWTYSVQIRSAVSLSFHAPVLRLPPSALLTVRSEATVATYRSADAGLGDFWSRVQPGDTLELRLEVAAAERSQFAMQISSFQAGFRGLSREVPNHPSVSRVRALAAGDPDTTCVQNYACDVTPGNSPVAQATVALLIGNLYQCTGTLINNTAQDNTPYVLTARHCQNGQYGGGGGGAAPSVTVYWNAITNCGTALGTVFYAPASARQSGATTVVEQQDAWLIQLNASPVVSDAHYAGFDASGSVVSGGYSIHHAQSYSKQITRWYGNAFARTATGVLGSTFVSDLLNTVNQYGAIGPGASGAGLFSGSDRLVGVLALGRNSSSVSGYGQCPAALPSSPDGNNWEAGFTSFAAVWNSTADATSSTGTRTLRSVLDPSSTGALSVGSMQAARISMDASQFTASWNTPVTLTWSAANATQCTATGGSDGDGWTGVLAGSGSKSVTQATGGIGEVTYRLRCNLAAGGTVSGSLVIRWQPPQSRPRFTETSIYTWINRPVELAWQSVIGPCAMNGGNVSETNLPASGSLTTTSSTPADITYILVCGVPGFTQSTQNVVSYVTPNLAFAVNGTRRKLGQQLQLAWYSFADSCVPTGGYPGDQWATSARSSQGFFQIFQVTTPGTFTYGLNCTSGPVTIQKSIQVTVDDAAPYVTLIPEKTSVTLSKTPSDYIRLRYATNIDRCTLDYNRFPVRAGILEPLPPATLLSLSYSEGEIVVAPDAPGTFNPTITCTGTPGAQAGPVSATTSVIVLAPAAPTATISTSATHVAMGAPFTITWSSTNASNCVLSGAAAEQGSFWSGPIGVSGSRLVQPLNNSQSDARYAITCPSIDASQPAATASVLVTIGSPRVSLSFSSLSPAMGTSFTLTWNEPNASSCSASGGGANGSPWSGALVTAGSVTQTASVAGTFVYVLNCVVNGVTRQSEAPITVAAASGGGTPPTNPGGTTPGGASGGGATTSGGGGGPLFWPEIAALLSLWGATLRRRGYGF